MLVGSCKQPMEWGNDESIQNKVVKHENIIKLCVGS